MRKLLCILTAILLTATASFARMPHISYGLEWGYAGTFFKHANYNYICEEGYRIKESVNTLRYFSNGIVLANVGIDVTSRLNVSAYSGLIGVYSKRWVVPAELRLRYCPAGNCSTGPVFYVAGGATFPTTTLMETGGRAAIGGGYRFAIFRTMSVEFLISYDLYTVDIL